MSGQWLQGSRWRTEGCCEVEHEAPSEHLWGVSVPMLSLQSVAIIGMCTYACDRLYCCGWHVLELEVSAMMGDSLEVISRRARLGLETEAGGPESLLLPPLLYVVAVREHLDDLLGIVNSCSHRGA